MSPIFTALTIYLTLSFIYWIWYLLVRPRIAASFIYKELFVLDMIYGILLVSVIPYIALYRLGVNNIILNWCLIAMAPAVFFHHLSCISQTPRLKGLISPKMHGVISHLWVFIPFGIAGVTGAVSFIPRVNTNTDLAILTIFLIETEFFSLLGVLVGLNVVKLPWK